MDDHVVELLGMVVVPVDEPFPLGLAVHQFMHGLDHTLDDDPSVGQGEVQAELLVLHVVLSPWVRDVPAVMPFACLPVGAGQLHVVSGASVANTTGARVYDDPNPAALSVAYLDKVVAAAKGAKLLVPLLVVEDAVERRGAAGHLAARINAVLVMVEPHWHALVDILGDGRRTAYHFRVIESSGHGTHATANVISNPRREDIILGGHDRADGQRVALMCVGHEGPANHEVLLHCGVELVQRTLLDVDAIVVDFEWFHSNPFLASHAVESRTHAFHWHENGISNTLRIFPTLLLFITTPSVAHPS